MKDLRFYVLFLLLSVGATQASDPASTFKRVNSVALSELPPGTTSYELYWIDGKDQDKSTKTLVMLIASAKKQRAKWMVASDSAAALNESLLPALQSSSSSSETLTEIVVVSPLTEDPTLSAVAESVGVKLIYRAIPAQ
jgi:hypothetical protein